MKQYATVLATSIYLHDTPAGKKIGSVVKGDRVEVLASEKRPQWTWYRVRKNSRSVGWLAGNPKWIALDTPKPPDVEPPSYSPLEHGGKDAGCFPWGVVVMGGLVAAILALVWYLI